MCGIIGYTGSENSVPKLLHGLSALEYRGYDSAGIAIFKDGEIQVIKQKGRLSNIAEKIADMKPELYSNCGIGHTRWATHGEPSNVNSHPHSAKNLTLVHNGIIENYLTLKKELEGLGYNFVSDTDTEIAAKLIDYFYEQSHDPFGSVKSALGRLKGSFALGIIFKDIPGKIFTTRRDNPLIIAISDKGNYIASDIPAILKYTNKYYQLAHDEIAIIEADKVTIYDKEMNIIEKELQEAKWDIDAAEKGGYPHFMIKEIAEEPSSVVKTIRPRILNGLPDLGIEELDDARLRSFKKISIVACGTAMHAGLVGKTAIERMARVPVDVVIASEFRYMNPIINKDDLVVIISQSGETADTLAALRLAKENGAFTLAVVNVAGSSIAREADSVLYTWAGPEIAVASTKAYIVQVCVMYLFATRLAMAHGKLSDDDAKSMMDELLNRIPAAIEESISLSEQCKEIADRYKDAHDIFYIGRGLDYDMAQEASLKLKEISYIHSEAYAAGELKHGTISLITDGVPVIALATDSSLYDKMVSNIKECKARGGKVIMLCKKNSPLAEEIADEILYLPDVSELYMPTVVMPLMQLLAYYASVLLGCDVDKPRNLAKSVTVE